MHLIATCPEEVKDALVTELMGLGADDIEPGFRAVSFNATEEVFYRTHLELRTASRVLKVIKSVSAQTPAMLFSQARRIAWPDLFDAQHAFCVEVLGHDADKGGLPHVQVITQVREAVKDVFMHRTGKAPKIDTEKPKIVVVAHLHNGRCSLSLDTSGKSLHKRGYRVSGHPAPIKETLAASLLILSGYDGTQPFLDPMCGSGTIAIEAAMIAVKKAPHIHRKKGDFSFEWHKDLNRELWRKTQDEARTAKLEKPPAIVAASDINGDYVKMAQEGALGARVERYMQFSTQRFQDVEPPAERGVLVTNLPYGERLATAEADLKTLYEEVGNTLKQKFSGWRAAMLAVNDSPHKFIGLKPTQKIPVLNGNIPCRLLIFDIYKGSRRAEV